MSSDKPKATLVEIPQELAGQRIDNYLLTRLKGVPKSHVYRLLRSGQVRVNSGRKKPHYKLQAGDSVRIPPVRIAETRAPLVPASVMARLKQAVLYEDDNILVLNKPSGIPVHGGSGLDYGIIEALKNHQPEAFLELAHRLDRDTSGCLVVAKNRATLTQLHDMLRNEAASGLKKTYLALVAGHWDKETTLTYALKKSTRGGERMVEVDADGAHAVSHFKPLHHYDTATLVQIIIDTGRTHQIRVHAAHAGHPVAGDPKYGDADFNRSMKRLGLKRMFLHASALELPIGDTIIVNAPLHEELENLLDKLNS